MNYFLVVHTGDDSMQSIANKPLLMWCRKFPVGVKVGDVIHETIVLHGSVDRPADGDSADAGLGNPEAGCGDNGSSESPAC